MENHSLIEQMVNNHNALINKARVSGIKPSEEGNVSQMKLQLVTQLLNVKVLTNTPITDKDVDMMRTLTNDMIVLIEAQLLISGN